MSLSWAPIRRVWLVAVSLAAMLASGCGRSSASVGGSRNLALLGTDPAPDSVLSTSPATIHATFDRPLDRSRVNSSWLRLVIAETPVAGEVTIDGAQPNVLRFASFGPLPAGVAVRVAVDGAVAAVDGAQLGTPLAWSFLIQASAATQLLFSPTSRLLAIHRVEVRSFELLRTSPSTLALLHDIGSSGGARRVAFWDEAASSWSSNVLSLSVGLGHMAHDGASGALIEDYGGAVAHVDAALPVAMSYLTPAGVPLRMADGLTTSWSRRARTNQDAASFDWQPATRDWRPTVAAADFDVVVDLVGMVPAAAAQVWQVVWRPATATARDLVAIRRDRAGVELEVVVLGRFATGSEAVVDRGLGGHVAVAILAPSATGATLHASVSELPAAFGPAVLVRGGAVGGSPRVRVGQDGACLVGYLTSDGAALYSERQGNGTWTALPEIPVAARDHGAAVAEDGSAWIFVRQDDDFTVLCRRSGKAWSALASLRTYGLIPDRVDVTVMTAMGTHASHAPAFLVVWTYLGLGAVDGTVIRMF